MTDNIILLTEIIESKVIKEKELEFYKQELIKITEKINYLEKELNLTRKIICIIETDSVKKLDSGIALIENKKEDNV